MSPETKKKPLKLNRLVITNIQGISHISILADPLVNEIVGKNRAGKTTVLRAILWGLGGKGNIPAEPIRIGEDEGEVWMDTDEFYVSRKFDKLDSGVTKTTVKIKLDEDDKSVGQNYLNSLIDLLSFNPLEFMRMTGMEQANIVKKLAGEDFVQSLKEFAEAEAEAYEERKDLKRDLKAMGRPEPVEKVERVAISDLVAEKQKITDFNTEQEEMAENRRTNEMLIADKRTEMGIFKKQLLEAEGEKKDLEAALEKLPKPEPLKPTEDIDARIAAVDELNAKATIYGNYLEAVKAIKAANLTVDAAEKKIKSIRRDRDKVIKATKIPIDGLSFTDVGITIDGRPLEQLSGQEQLDLSVRIGITLNPSLGIMLIQNGEQLDEEGMNQLIDLAEKNGRQLWVATVGDGHESVRDRGQQLIIEEGHIKK